jgi:transglutaminase-like putative cysteine protease
MLRTIQHSTLYHYHQPVSFGSHRLLVRPREGHDVRVESLKLQITPAHRVSWCRDVFGNSIAWVDFLNPSTELSINVDTILHYTSLPLLPDSPRLRVYPYPPQYSDMELPIVLSYLQSVYPAESQELSIWLEQLPFVLPATNAVALALSLNGWINQHICYRRREERGVQSPLETLRLMSGSCRDMATLLMESCRSLGLAARFASGYLDTIASRAGTASTHAWIEVYHPESGWCGYDPTLNEVASHKHIVCGVSSHPRGVMPVSGAFFGDGSLYDGMVVSVRITLCNP